MIKFNEFYPRTFFNSLNWAVVFFTWEPIIISPPWWLLLISSSRDSKDLSDTPPITLVNADAERKINFFPALIALMRAITKLLHQHNQLH